MSPSMSRPSSAREWSIHSRRIRSWRAASGAQARRSRMVEVSAMRAMMPRLSHRPAVRLADRRSPERPVPRRRLSLVEEARRGRFITLEGPDGAGKSSRAKGLAAWLRGRDWRVTLTREPGGTPLGEGVRELLLHSGAARSARSDALLFAAARAEHVATVIRPALERGEIVVCDRFGDSTLAYQGYGGGEDLAELEHLVAYATGGLRPDLTLLLDLGVETGLTRRAGGPAAGQTRFEDAGLHDRAFHERVRAGFLALAGAEPERWRVIDAARSPARVAAEVEAAVGAWLEPFGQG